jgi:hypothetical protein
MQKAEWKCYERVEDNARESEGRISQEKERKIMIGIQGIRRIFW